MKEHNESIRIEIEYYRWLLKNLDCSNYSQVELEKRIKKLEQRRPSIKIGTLVFSEKSEEEIRNGMKNNG